MSKYQEENFLDDPYIRRPEMGKPTVTTVGDRCYHVCFKNHAVMVTEACDGTLEFDHDAEMPQRIKASMKAAIKRYIRNHA